MRNLSEELQKFLFKLENARTVYTIENKPWNIPKDLVWSEEKIAGATHMAKLIYIERIDTAICKHEPRRTVLKDLNGKNYEGHFCYKCNNELIADTWKVGSSPL